MTNNPGTGVPGNAIEWSILNIDVAFQISQACCACCLNAVHAVLMLKQCALLGLPSL